MLLAEDITFFIVSAAEANAWFIVWNACLLFYIQKSRKTLNTQQHLIDNHRKDVYCRNLPLNVSIF